MRPSAPSERGPARRAIAARRAEPARPGAPSLRGPTRRASLARALSELGPARRPRPASERARQETATATATAAGRAQRELLALLPLSPPFSQLPSPPGSFATRSRSRRTLRPAAPRRAAPLPRGRHARARGEGEPGEGRAAAEQQQSSSSGVSNDSTLATPLQMLDRSLQRGHGCPRRGRCVATRARCWRRRAARRGSTTSSPPRSCAAAPARPRPCLSAAPTRWRP